MDKELILKHLKKEHLKGNDELYEIADVSGLDVVKELFRNHEGMRMCYIPMLVNNKSLMRDFLRVNKTKFTVHQLVEITGKSRRKIEEMIAEIEMKD